MSEWFDPDYKMVHMYEFEHKHSHASTVFLTSFLLVVLCNNFMSPINMEALIRETYIEIHNLKYR